MKEGVAHSERAETFDWADVYRRLGAAESAITQVWAPTIHEKQKILEQRAAVLAAEAPLTHLFGEELEIIEFSVAHERYGIEASYTKEVYPLRELTPLPSTPPFVLGVVNVRGRILSVLDIKKFFELPDRGLTDLNKVLIVEASGMEVGLLADAVHGVRRIPLATLQGPLPTLTGVRAEYLLGIAPERLTVLDVQKVLGDPKIRIHEEIHSLSPKEVGQL